MITYVSMFYSVWVPSSVSLCGCRHLSRCVGAVICLVVWVPSSVSLCGCRHLSRCVGAVICLVVCGGAVGIRRICLGLSLFYGHLLRSIRRRERALSKARLTVNVVLSTRTTIVVGVNHSDLALSKQVHTFGETTVDVLRVHCTRIPEKPRLRQFLVGLTIPVVNSWYGMEEIWRISGNTWVFSWR